MKIAQIANVAERVPPKKYGGTERVISALTEELVNRGHDVTLFASGDTLTSAKLSPITPNAVRDLHIKDPYGLNPLSLQNYAQAYLRQDEFDIIHDHNWLISMPTANLARKPVVMTIHSAIELANKNLFESMKNINYVAVSKAQHLPAPNINFIATIYHGLKMDTYPFSEENDGYLLCVGQLSVQKGIHHAIEIAESLNMSLVIAAKKDPQDEVYFKQYIQPYLSDKIRWVGEVNEEERNRLMSRALCLLHPVDWREPFGLTMIEAMACGSPVIAFRRGSIPEVIKDRKTGFVVEDVDEMAGAVQRINTINRLECRQYALEQFSVERMTDEYEAVYKKLVNGKEKKIDKEKI